MEICRCICYRFVRRPEYKYGNGVWSVLFLIKYVGLNHDESIATHSWNRLKSQSWFQSWYFSNLICTLVIQNQIKYTPLSFYLYLRQPDLFATQNLCNVSIYILLQSWYWIWNYAVYACLFYKTHSSNCYVKLSCCIHTIKTMWMAKFHFLN